MSTELTEFYGSLAPGERDALQAADAQLDTVLGKDTEGIFQKGEALIIARDRVPDRTFSKWCSLRWPSHRTYAYAHMRVAEHLGIYRSRLVRAGVHPSTLLFLASRPGRAEALLNLHRDGQRPTYKQAKAVILGEQDGPTPEAAHPTDPGGLAGLRLLHAAKKDRLPEVRDRIDRIIVEIEAAVAAPRLLKGKLADEIKMEARWAQAELYNLCAFVGPAPWDHKKPIPIRFAKGSGWARVIDTLYDLGGKESWPHQRDLERWLVDNVLPTLLWAARGEGEITAGTAAHVINAPHEETARDAIGHRVRANGARSETEHTEDPLPADTRPHSLQSVEPEAADVETCSWFLLFLREHCVSAGTPIDRIEEILQSSATVLGEIWRDSQSVFGQPVDDAGAHALAEAAYLTSLDEESSLTKPWSVRVGDAAAFVARV